jgi:hypothetical protein
MTGTQDCSPESCEHRHSKTPPARNKYSIIECARLLGISTIKSAATVKNQPKNELKMRLKHQMGHKWAIFRSNRAAPIYMLHA